jgi:DNA modification methylase
VESDYLGPYLLGPNDTPENGIYTGDARELAQAIPDESVDLIFTDPVYDRIDDYRWLAETGARVLREEGDALVWFDGRLLPSIVTALTEGGLQYQHQLILYRNSGPSRRLWMGHGKYISCLWFFPPGKVRTQRETIDLVTSPFNCTNGYHKWQKSLQGVYRWLRDLASAGATIFDPFTGGGTVPAVCKMLGHRYLAFEIDPDAAEMARERVRNTQPPLPLEMPEQGVLL